MKLALAWKIENTANLYRDKNVMIGNAVFTAILRAPPPLFLHGLGATPGEGTGNGSRTDTVTSRSQSYVTRLGPAEVSSYSGRLIMY